MGLDIWFREDVARAILAAEQASATTAAAMERALSGVEGAVAGDPQYLQAYREGYKAALVTVATAFGLKSPEDGFSQHLSGTSFQTQSECLFDPLWPARTPRTV
ncbi:MAG: hypothetical protein SVX38_02205 [Chloroflexota bacterium]|nr:hypothetical protein [Chloroflexota bacterium]